MSGIFAGKYGLITLRDLFRWAERYWRSNCSTHFHDWDQQLAEDGKYDNYIKLEVPPTQWHLMYNLFLQIWSAVA